MKEQSINILKKWKYEILLLALIAHLYIGIFLRDLDSYTRIIWPINMLILGIASIGVFIEKGKWKNLARNILFVLVLALPISLPFLERSPRYMSVLSVIYFLFFAFIFYEIIRFLIRPSYINIDIISACICGYFLLIEISVFLLQAIFYMYPESLMNIDTSGLANTYMDLVYFSSISITGIGFGDITPGNHRSKLIVSLFGVISQFYSVVLVGILISKFSSKM